MPIFKLEPIKKCEICNSQNTQGIRELISEHFGFGDSSKSTEICEGCLDKHTYTNNLLFTFLFFNKKKFYAAFL
jgi:hypothetical protein